ncbi:MAG: hypothetical protein JXA73_18295 [Acidobacteria bacterium]|nr:hypothetical protein [Acidobacteriota bacterium]
MMKAAFACWANRIAPVFDTARQIHVISVESGQIAGEKREMLLEDFPVQKTLRLVELGIGTLVCGAISRTMHAVVDSYGIQVIPFIAGDLSEVIQAWFAGNLRQDAFGMPGCRGRGNWRFRGMHGISKEVDIMNARGRGMGSGGRGGQGRGQGGGGRGMGSGGRGGQGQGQGGGGRGRMGGPVAGGPTGSCVCPQCGSTEPHQRGVPCSERQCPKCGAFMTRQ